VKTTGVVLLLIGISAAFGYIIALYELPDLTGKFLSGLSSTPWVIFLLVNVILFVLGTFLDMAATILVCTPIFLPIAKSFGIDPVHFGVIMILNLGIGLNTPPLGPVQFVAAAVGKITVWEAMRSIWPFYGAGLIVLGLVTYIPALSLWLPALFRGN